MTSILSTHPSVHGIHGDFKGWDSKAVNYRSVVILPTGHCLYNITQYNGMFV